MRRFWRWCGEHVWRACYVLGALLLTLFLAGNAALDAVCYAAGLLRTGEITLADAARYELVNMEQTDGATLCALNGDAQFLLKPGQRVRTVRVVGRVNGPAERDLYYHLPGLGYTPLCRVWPVDSEDGGDFLYVLPQLTGANVRLDLADRAGTTVTVERIVWNEPIPLWRALLPQPWRLFLLAVLPGFLACGVLLVQDMRGGKRRRGARIR